MIIMSNSNSFFIDFVRVLAAQFVLLGHSFSFFSVSFLKDQTYFPYIQNIGVVLLFALSGFLFSYTCKRRGGYGFGRYYLDRVIRIKIPYIGAMIIVFLISLATIFIKQEAFHYYNAFNIKTFLMNIFMFQDYPCFSFFNKFAGTNIVITSYASARPFWTLAIEWWYYMFFGYFYFYLKNKNKIHISDIFIYIFFSVVPLYNLFGGRGNCLTLVWIGGIIVENLYKVIKIESKILKRGIAIVLLVLLVTDGIYEKDAYSRNFQVLVLLCLFFVFINLKDINYDTSKYKICKTVKLLAAYSYSLYLLHYSILDFIYCLPDWNVPNWIKSIIGILLSNIVAYTFAQFFEKKSSYIVKKCQSQADNFLKSFRF